MDVTVTLSGTGGAQVGVDATFLCQISGGQPATGTYQWFVRGVEVDSETSASYTFAPTISDDGSDVECQVDNGLISSGKVTLDLQSKRKHIQLP